MATRAPTTARWLRRARGRPAASGRSSGTPRSRATCRVPSTQRSSAIRGSCGAGSSRSTGSASACSRAFRVESGEVARVAELFGHVRVTNYGRVFDVRSVVEPANLAYTPLGLGPHTDNPYRDPVPTLQLLHCLVLERERRREHARRRLLRRRGAARRAARPSSRCSRAQRDVRLPRRRAPSSSASAPIIELDPHGDVRAVRFNARSLQSPAMPRRELAAWYDAYLRFAPHARGRARFQVRLRLEPGDLFIVDNRRVLHGRAPYAAERRASATCRGATPTSTGCAARSPCSPGRPTMTDDEVIDDDLRGVPRARRARPTSASRSRSREHMLQTAHGGGAGRRRPGARRVRAAARLRPPRARAARGLRPSTASTRVHEEAGAAWLERALRTRA